MKNKWKFTTILILFSMAISLTYSTENSYAFWSTSVESAQTTTTTTFTIGTWNENPNETWAPNTTYYTGDIVFYNGSYYEARRTVTNLAPNSVWYSFFFWRQVSV